MSDIEISKVKEAGDLGLGEPDLDRVSARVSAALDREYEAEDGRGGVPPRTSRWRRGRRYVLAALLAVLLGGVATAGYAALTGSSTSSDGVGCYPGDEIGGSVTAVSLDGRSAVKTCADLWAAGEVKPGLLKAPAPLHACVSGDGDGSIRVLSSVDASICERVGLVEHAAAGSDPAARRFGGFSSQLSAVLERNERNGQNCAGREQMRGLVERLLAAHRLTDWTISEIGFDHSNRCATLGLDSDARVVTMFAMRP